VGVGVVRAHGSVARPPKRDSVSELSQDALTPYPDVRGARPPSCLLPAPRRSGRDIASTPPSQEPSCSGGSAPGSSSPLSLLAEEIEALPTTPAGEEAVRLHRELRDLRVPADVIVVSRDYADRWRGVRGDCCDLIRVTSPPRSRSLGQRPFLSSRGSPVRIWSGAFLLRREPSHVRRRWI
jgi:hypothetical protein